MLNRLPRIACCLACALAAASQWTPAGAVPPAFSNRTTETGTTFSQASSNFNLWWYSGGACAGDFNRDGFQDLFVPKGGATGAKDKLFINNGDGTFTDRATEWGLTGIHKGKGCSVGDYNGDGWLDIYLSNAGNVGAASAPGKNKLYRNNGNSTFTDVAVVARVHATNIFFEDSWSSCFGDYDLDGDLDLFVGGFYSGDPGNDGNRLFRNKGDGTYDDVTAAIGLLAGLGPIAAQSCSFVDLDGDRYPELLITADFKGAGFIGSRYFKNNGNGTFTDLTVASHTGVEENGMGQAFGDFDNDGLIDWYCTSIYGFPPAGWTGNKLYHNNGNHDYTEISNSAACKDGGYGWGALMIDFNHDGWLDIMETNGDNSGGGQYFEQSYLWMNNGNNTFTEGALAAGFSSFGKGRCLVRFDYDNDGDQDTVLISNNGPLKLFRNDLPAGPNTSWLRVFLQSSRHSPGGPMATFGIGARVQVTVGPTTYVRSIDACNSFLGVSELSAHFGLGTATLINELKVLWANGTQTVLTNVPVNQTLTISSLPTCPADADGSGGVGIDDLLAVINTWGSCGPACAGDVAPAYYGNSSVDIDDLLLVINGWGKCP